MSIDDRYVVNLHTFSVDGRIPVNYDGCLNDDGDEETCCGCGQPVGSLHEYGCDWERCPQHEHEQLLFCCQNITIAEYRELVAEMEHALAALTAAPQEREEPVVGY